MLTLATAIATSPAFADVVSLAPTGDTFIHFPDVDSNAGANPWFDAGTDGNGGVRRGLIQFDVSSIPPGSTITSAVLRMVMTKVPGNGSGAVNSSFELRRMTTGWAEGVQGGTSGSPALPGEATWSARMKDVLPWTTPGATNDARIAASASVAIGATLFTPYSWTGTGVVADVQFWVNNPSVNAGWLLTSTAESGFRTVRGFASREDVANGPRLEVGYISPNPPGPARFASITLTNAFLPTPPLLISNGLLTLTWSGDTNSRFDLQYSTSLSSNEWRLAQANIPADMSGSNVLTDPPYLASPAYGANSNVFYRVESLPPSKPALAVRLQVVVTNLVSPTVLTHAGDGSGRMFIADQVGHVRIVDPQGNLLPGPFLDISNRMVVLQPGYDERGLLGLVFHPGYATNGRFFVYYAAPSTNAVFNNQTVLSEFAVSAGDPNVADASSERILLTIDQPEFNHEGGALAFGPDGYLYIASGDGGGGGDQHGPFGNAQVLTNLLGKILRIDVDGTNSDNGEYGIPLDNPFVGTAGARTEIYAYGFRNPWRFSFDRGGSQRAFVADVGQNVWEEVNILRKGGNYGWRIMEGLHAFDPALAALLNVDIPGLEQPIIEYPHGPLGISIIGGFVYRGTGYPQLAGKYVFGDFSTGFGAPAGVLYYLDETRPGIWEHFTFQLHPGGGNLGRFLKGFGEDESGEIYVLSTFLLGPSGTSGDVRKLVRP